MSVGDLGNFMKKFLLGLLTFATVANADLRYNEQTDKYFCAHKSIFYKVDQEEYDRLAKNVCERYGILNNSACIIGILHTYGTDTAKQLILDVRKLLKKSKK